MHELKIRMARLSMYSHALRYAITPGWLPVLLIALVTLSMQQPAQSQPGDKQIASDSLRNSFLAFKGDLDEGVNTGVRRQVVQAKFGLRQYIDHPQLGKPAAYFIAYADYRLSSLFEEVKDSKKEEYLDAAIRRLEQLTQTDPDNAEAWALLGNCYGMKATGMISGMQYGPKSEKAIETAIELQPDNPRVTMIHGISLMYKPALFGGSLEKSVEVFHDAAKLFRERPQQEPLQPDWGAAENYAWLAQAYIRQDRFQQARDSYLSALEIRPGYYWVGEVLLPELRRQMN